MRMVLILVFLAIALTGFAQPKIEARAQLSDRWVGWTMGSAVTLDFGKHRLHSGLDYLTSSGYITTTKTNFQNVSKRRNFFNGFGGALGYSFKFFEAKKYPTRLYVVYDLHISRYEYRNILLVPYGYAVFNDFVSRTYTKVPVRMPPTWAFVNTAKLEFNWNIHGRLGMFVAAGGGIGFFEKTIAFDNHPSNFTARWLAPVLDVGITLDLTQKE